MSGTSHWKGQLRLSDYYACWSGSVGDAASHRHFAAQAVFSDEKLTAIDASGAHLSGQCILIEPDTLHRLLPAPTAELWFVEPTVGFGPPEELRRRLLGCDAVFVAERARASFWESWLTRDIRRPLDPRVARAAASVDRLISKGLVRLADTATDCDLSLGRFRHLFAAEVGMPFKRYVLWRRLLIAFEAIEARYSATEAAHLAGFSDSPHFARTIKTMFGIRASDLLIEP